LEAEVEGSRIAERIRDGFEVAILGKPNIGKSTLLNAFAGREAAITSETAGTTRDVIEVRMDLSGLPVTFLDTAGLREAEDSVERIGIDRAKARGQAADLRVFLVEAPGERLPFEPSQDDIVVVGKADLYSGDQAAVSGMSGVGVSELVSNITKILSARASISATAMRARQRVSISEALGFISAARVEAEQGEARIEYASENLHRAIHALDVLIGKVDVEHVLDEIFSSFCLGK
jgi:tRNA modification GTPase